MTHQPGDVIGDGNQFQLIGPLSDQGNQGVVWEAKDLRLGRHVIIKFPKNGGADDRLEMEASVTGLLDHPGIVSVHTVGQLADGTPFYVMRKVEGQRLSKEIKTFHENRHQGFRGMEFRRLLHLFIDVCRTIHYAHRRELSESGIRGVLHCDIKPGNIMIGPHEETQVIDWGMAELLRTNQPGDVEGTLDHLPYCDDTRSKPPGGTPAYMSPEQFMLAELEPTSDVYSLGATLYQILTGVPSTTGNAKGSELRRCVLNGKIDWSRTRDLKVPRVLESICRTAMRMQPGERYQTAKELANELERWLAADEPVRAHRYTWMEKVGRWKRQHPKAGLIATISAIFILILAIGWTKDSLELRRIAESERDNARFAASVANTQRDRANAATSVANAATQQAEQERDEAKHQRQVAQQERDEATLQRAIAQRQRDWAQKQFALTDATLSATIDMSDFVKFYPRWQHVRWRVLEMVADHYHKLSEIRSDEPELPEVTAGAAEALLRLGDAMRLLERRREAADAYGRAGEMFVTLVKSHPSAEYSISAADSLLGLGETRDDNDLRDASFAEAIALMDALLDEEPDNQVARILRANISAKQLLMRTSQGPEPDRILAEPIYGYQDLQPSGVPAHRVRELADLLLILVQLKSARGESKDVPSMLQKASDLYSDLLARDNQHPDYHVGIARTTNELANIHAQDGYVLQARINYGRAIKSYDRLAAQFPDVVSLRSQLAMVNYNYAVLLRSLGFYHDAIGRAEETLKILAETPPIQRSPSLSLTAVACHSMLGDALLCVDRDEEAQRAVEKALAILNECQQPSAEIDVEVARCRSYAGNRFLKLKDYVAAENEFMAAAASLSSLVDGSSPADHKYVILADVYRNLGDLFAATDRPKDATQYYRKEMSIRNAILNFKGEKDAIQLAAMAWLLAKCEYAGIRDTESAVTRAQQAFELAPENDWLLVTLGLALYEDGQTAECLDELAKLDAAASPVAKSARYFIAALAHQQTGNQREATSSYRQAELEMLDKCEGDPRVQFLKSKAAKMVKLGSSGRTL